MASSTREVLITIKLEKEIISTPASNEQSTPKEVKDDKEKDIKSILIHQGIQVAKQTIVQSVSSTANRYFSMKEDYINEQLYRNVTSTIGKGIGLVSTVYAGAKLGAVGGPAGMAAGAGIAATGFLIGEGISLFNKYSQYYQTLNASNMGVEFARTRAGLIDNGRGTEN